ncbi:hypothetical protein Y032_0633g893 [Ancylostoma ceylanicum]|uniref:Uncharacterized protein n=1 Tax=Ancylostoma ceylanicum TaxID=53326 RepID=A0A016WK42_9BILA|nr:hypothetical protein Y032_0633g893 [Ancylostoma ceylanicum]
MALTSTAGKTLVDTGRPVTTVAPFTGCQSKPITILLGCPKNNGRSQENLKLHDPTNLGARSHLRSGQYLWDNLIYI